MLSTKVLDDLKSFKWQKVIDIGNTLDDLSDHQWRFMKGFIAEILVEECSGSLVYVGDIHKDYDWPKHNLTVELKSQLSGPMYNKSGLKRKRYIIKLNNTRGTNTKEVIQDDMVADIILIVNNDGAYAIDKETAIKYTKHLGDGFEIIIPSEEVIELTGKMTVKTHYQTNFKEQIKKLITESIKQL